MPAATSIAHRLSVSLLVAYALLALVGAVAGVPSVRVAAFAALIVAVSLSLTGRAGWRGWALWLAVIALFGWLMARGAIALAMDAVPMLFNAAACALFAGTLRRGHEPLVSRIVRVMEGSSRLELAGVRAYARRVTQFWALLLGTQALALLVLWLCIRPGGLLAVTGVPAPWSIDAHAAAWYAHLGVYLLPLLAMLGEHALRRRVLCHMPHDSLPVFGWRLLKCWPQLVRETVTP